jgi:ribosomal subunit interface protein
MQWYNGRMDIRTKTTNYEMTADASAYLDERIAAIERMLGEDAHAARLEVEIARDGGDRHHSDHMWKVEFLVQYPGSQRIRASNRAQSVNAAIDDAKEEIVRQLRGERQAHRRIMRKTGAAIKRFLRFGGEE